MFAQMVEVAKSSVLRDANLEEPERPEEGIAQLPVELADLTDGQMMSLFARFTRWADYFSFLVAMDEVQESFAKAQVDRLEDLFMLANKPEKPATGDMTILKAAMEAHPEIAAAREAYRTVYAHRKLMSTFYESAVRDAAAVSREETRRLGREDYERRVDRRNP